MLKQIRLVLTDLYRYQWIYLFRCLLLQVVVGVGGSFLLSEVFYFILAISSEDQLTTTNVTAFLVNPLVWLGLLVYVLFFALLTYIEFAVLVDIIRRKDRKASLSLSRFKIRVKDFAAMMSGWQTLPFVGYVLLTIPVIQVFTASTLLDKVYLPHFITDEFLKTPQTAVAMVLVGALAYYLNLRLIYVMPLTVLRLGTTFWDNVVRSWQLTRGKTFKLVFGLFILSLPLGLLFTTIFGLLLAFLYVVDIFTLSNGIQWVMMTFIWGWSFSLTMVTKLITVSYLLTQLDKHHQPAAYQQLPQIPRRKRWLALTALCLMGIGQFVVNYDRLTYRPYNKAVQTIAHRGDVTGGVENSLEALTSAAAHRVDYVEMDIILSKDNQFIVSHDNNLKRLTGQDIAISDSLASDLVGLPITQGDLASQLVDFDTYVNKAKDLHTKLMVELKPHGQEPDNYAQLVVDTFRRLKLTKSYKLMSLDLEVIEAVEKLAPEIETGHIIPFQFGYLASEQVDFILIEDFSYRERLVWEASWRQQDLYVWTINRSDQMTNYLQSPVAGVITDELSLLEETKRDLTENDSYLDRLLRLIN